MKVFVIVYGLIGFVRLPDDPGKIMALMVDTHGMEMSTGEPAMEHFAEVGLFKSVEDNGIYKLKSDQIIGLAGEDVQIGPFTDGEVSLDVLERQENGSRQVLFFSQVLTKEKSVVAPGCIGYAPRTECARHGRGLLSGRLILSGEIAIRPIDLDLKVGGDLSSYLGTPRPDIFWGLRSVETGEPIGQPNPYASAIALVGTVKPHGSLKLKIGGADVAIPELKPINCATLMGVTGVGTAGQPCAFVLMTNAPYHQDLPKPSTEIYPDHTELLFNLFRDKSHPLSEYRQKVLGKLSGNGVGNHCVNGFMEPPQ